VNNLSSKIQIQIEKDPTGMRLELMRGCRNGYLLHISLGRFVRCLLVIRPYDRIALTTQATSHDTIKGNFVIYIHKGNIIIRIQIQTVVTFIMGIHGLMKLLSEECPGAIKQQEFESYTGSYHNFFYIFDITSHF